MKTRFGLGRSVKQVWDNLYMIMAVLVILSALTALILASHYPVTYPVCFFIAALMQVCRGSSLLCMDERHKRSIVWGCFVYATAVALIVLGILGIASL